MTHPERPGQYERALIRARTKSALAVKKTRGERVGGIPYGSRLGADRRTLEPHADELRALELLHALRASGHTMAAVAKELNRLGYRTRRGGPWVRQAVHMMLSSAA
jgi:site-specific DNA recombinase